MRLCVLQAPPILSSFNRLRIGMWTVGLCSIIEAAFHQTTRRYIPEDILLIFTAVRTTELIGRYNPCICLSVRPSSCNNCRTAGRIFMKFDIGEFYCFSSHLDPTYSTMTWNEDALALLRVSREGKISNTSCTEKWNSFYVQYGFFRILRVSR
jgi:hypothetical protein